MDIKLFKTALVWLAGQVPLLGAAYAYWTPIQQNPFGALLLALVYEIVVAGVAFGRGFVGKVWAQLEPDMVKATAEWVRGLVRGFAPGFRKRYNQQVIYDHRVFNVRGLRTQGSFTLELEHVFIALRIAPGNMQQPNTAAVQFNRAHAEWSGQPKPIWDFLRGMQSTSCGALAIVGAPGCGKTTLLQHLALTLAANRQRPYKLKAYTPVMLFLRDHFKKIVADSPTLAALAQDYFADAKRYANLNPPPHWFKQQLEAGRCLVLLDGLDEVDTPDNRRKVSAWVDQQIRNYPRCLFVLSARPQGYRDAPLQQAHILEILPFTAAQVKQFVHNWYLANEIMSFAGKRDDGVRQEATRRADDLLARLRQLPALNELTVNPLLLTMIATVHRYRGQLPGRRVELYSEICDVLLGHRRQAVGVAENLSAAQKRVALQPLACHMALQKQLEITAEAAQPIIAPYLTRLGLSDEAARTFLKEVEASSGLFVESDPGHWRFAHKTFLEYLTAAHWIEENKPQDWAALVQDSWWHETLRLYAAQRDGSDIAEACLAQRSTATWLLAVDLSEEARELSATVRAKINETLSADLESADDTRFSRAAEMLLQKRQRRLAALPDRVVLDDEWITHAEYQLFLNELRSQGKHYQPDHWTQWRFPAGQANTPVLGVRFKDAQAFCEWLNQRQFSQSQTQLPQTTPNTTSVAQPNMGWWLSTGKLALISMPTYNLAPPPLPPLEEVMNFSLARGRDLDLDLGLAVASFRDLDIGPDYAKDITDTSVFTRFSALKSDLAIDLNLDPDLDLARKQIKQTLLILDQKTPQSVIQTRHITLLKAILQVLLHSYGRPFEMIAWRKAYRAYICLLAEYIWLRSQEFQKDQKQQGLWGRLRHWRQDSINFKAVEDYASRAYWYIKIMMMREAGELPAWEGIRIERVKNPE